MSEPDHPFPSLVQAVLAGTATAGQHEQLARLLQLDAGLRTAYVRQMRLDALLHFTGGAVAKKTAPADSPTRAGRISPLPSFWLMLIAAAAWTVGPTLGLFVTGAFLVLTGLAADRSSK